MNESEIVVLPAPPPLRPDNALFLDFDGTLVEIAAAPDRIEVMAGLPDLLQRVGARLGGALAVISGRPLVDLGRFLAGYSGAAAGVHGLERRSPSGATRRPRPDPALGTVLAALREFAAATPGVLIEDKALSVGVHYRSRPELADACRRAAEQAAVLAGNRLTVRSGKMVFELQPREANKGHAVVDFLAEPEFRGRRPVFVGDDRTDEDGFAVVNERGGLSIRVGAANGSAARYRLDDVAAVIGWLARLLGT